MYIYIYFIYIYIYNTIQYNIYRSDGDFYKGEWKDDMRHGKGHFFAAKGSSYQGDYVKNKCTGHGKYIWYYIYILYIG